MRRAGVENRIKHMCRAIIMVIGLFVLCVGLPFPANARENVIKVGYIDQCSFLHEENGEYRGYAVEYLEEISDYTGWKYEYVYDTWEECLEMLETGEIQLVCMAEYLPEHADKYLYRTN